VKADHQLTNATRTFALAFLFALIPIQAQAQSTQPATAPASQPAQPTTFPTAQPLPIAPELTGRNVEAIRILGNHSVSNSVILNVVRTREGQPFDPATVEEDYHRIFNLHRFSSVQAQVEPTIGAGGGPPGVIVVFIVDEQKLLTAVNFKGNENISTESIQEAVDLRKGDAIDRFRIALARQAIEALYREKNYPYAHVSWDENLLGTKGELTFNIVEGPEVRIRKVDFVGNNSFTRDRLLDQIETRSWIWILRPGKLDQDQLEDDEAKLRRYYLGKGFFDVRIGRKVIVSPDQTEVQVNFIINEGLRYRIDRIVFDGNRSVSETRLRENLNLHEGDFYDQEVIDRDIHQIVKAYSPFGFVYVQGSKNPDYLRINAEHVVTMDPGHASLKYIIEEGKPFRLGRVIVSGNTKSQDKLVFREMRVEPGQLYNSAELQDAQDRIKSRPYFDQVSMTPIGDDPNVRDVLVEVHEAKTAIFQVGAAVSSDGGLAGQFIFNQKNFDIANAPGSVTDIFAEHAFTGAGQDLRITLEPGTKETNASIAFSEPYLFDSDYNFFIEGYRRSRFQEVYEESHLGGRTTLGRRFGYIWSANISLRGEDTNIHDIEEPRNRAAEILAQQGHSTVTSLGASITRNTLVGGFLPYKGSSTTAAFEQIGALGGDWNFRRYTLEWSDYHLLSEDLLDRKTVLNLRGFTGFITGYSIITERFYGGCQGSLRGFDFRGVSPRAGRENDRVGGTFQLTGTAEVSFPLAGDILRGVVFTDAGTVEPDVKLGTIRWSAGAGIRLMLPVPILSQGVPIAIDFGYPIHKAKSDDTRYISFSLGFQQ